MFAPIVIILYIIFIVNVLLILVDSHPLHWAGAGAGAGACSSLEDMVVGRVHVVTTQVGDAETRAV